MHNLGGNNTKYIHYGHIEFDTNKFEPIQNRIYSSKPKGGLWASPIDAEYGWKDWCKDESFRDCVDGNSFTFEISGNANIIYLNSIDDLSVLPKVKDEKHTMSWVCLDFEKLVSQGIDCIQVNISKSYELDTGFDNDLYWALYGWDCDSIVIMNPDVIQIERKDAA